jgi:hypothetical protein
MNGEAEATLKGPDDPFFISGCTVSWLIQTFTDAPKITEGGGGTGLVIAGLWTSGCV